MPEWVLCEAHAQTHPHTERASQSGSQIRVVQLSSPGMVRIFRLPESRRHGNDDEKVRQLLQREALGDRKPSHLLRFMRALAGSTPVDDSLLLIMWLDRLPSLAKAILQVQPNLPLDQLAEIADRVIEASPPPPPLFVHAAGAPQPTPELASRIDEIVRRILFKGIWINARFCVPESAPKAEAETATHRKKTTTAAATTIGKCMYTATTENSFFRAHKRKAAAPYGCRPWRTTATRLIPSTILKSTARWLLVSPLAVAHSAH
ncbi:hypothetical protein HPB49_020092 [Dermacentor silvarum]|uniref:Uncharacterized protein n=1 Tax=Dermacentor silvarum TaxID=543639 RepID=A0ACB8C5A1_DERSI|nr:hypothetical protein HPB49_020092 [Dermacentor silvarum]